MLQKRVNLFGLKIDDISMAGALEIFKKRLDKEEKTLFFTPNLEMLAAAHESDRIKEMLNCATVSLPDGFGLKIIGKLMGSPIQNTVAGIDFGECALEIAAKRGKRVFLLGGRAGVAESAVENLKRKHPTLEICGVQHGFFSEEELTGVIEKINSSGAEILIVCMGFPRQERFALRVRGKLTSVRTLLCLGGSLDVWAWEVKRAPALLQRSHLEWAWRIICEPQRAKRFVRSLSPFPSALAIFIKKIGMKRGGAAYNQTKQDDRGG